MTALVGLECNGCGTRLFRHSFGQVSTTPIRRDAKAEGWHKTYGDDGTARDVCAMCWERGVR
jgi:hypothetical protein